MAASKSAKNGTTLIACPTCDARVQATVIAQREFAPGPDWEPHRYAFVECTVCETIMVGYSEWGTHDPEEEDWGPLSREWPSPDTQFNAGIPRGVRRSLDEAQRCFKVKSYMACAVMCGRAIEGIAKDKTGAKYLAEGLKKLKTAKIIDEKLFEWGEALRAERNIGAHAGEEVITMQDARDVLDFATAISEYVYVLGDRYRRYKERKAK